MIVQMENLKVCTIIALVILSGCGIPSIALGATPVPAPASSQTEMITQVPPPIQTEVQLSTSEENEISEEIAADILSVKIMGSQNSYQFQVEVSSPDTGCDQYADWWEVLSEDGQLLYRRV